MLFNCRLCQGDGDKSISAIDAKSREPLPISVCRKCGLVQQTILPSDDELRIYYSHNYRRDYKKTYEPKSKYVWRAGIAAKDRLKFLQNYVPLSPHSKLLDIGAGGGEFVYLASKSGYTAKGIEPNEGYSQFAKAAYGIDINNVMLDKLEFGSSDVVTLFHVYEHMAHPLAVMKKIANTLTNGGYLFIEVPNILQNDASPHNIFFKAHLFYYSRYTLTASASPYFDVVKIIDDGNIKAIFKKKEGFNNAVELPTAEEVRHTMQRLNEKGWIEYLFWGGGLLKPLRKIGKFLQERQIQHYKPKDLLDAIL